MSGTLRNKVGILTDDPRPARGRRLDDRPVERARNRPSQTTHAPPGDGDEPIRAVVER